MSADTTDHSKDLKVSTCSFEHTSKKSTYPKTVGPSSPSSPLEHSGYELDCKDGSAFSEFVFESDTSEFTCAICRGICKKAVTLCATGHVFCESCLEGWQKSCPKRTRSTCPTCRGSLPGNKVVSLRLIDNLVSKLKVRCAVRMRADAEADDSEVIDFKACKWQGSLDALSAHVETCHASCENRKRGCSWRGPSSDASSHAHSKACAFRIASFGPAVSTCPKVGLEETTDLATFSSRKRKMGTDTFVTLGSDHRRDAFVPSGSIRRAQRRKRRQPLAKSRATNNARILDSFIEAKVPRASGSVQSLNSESGRVELTSTYPSSSSSGSRVRSRSLRMMRKASVDGQKKKKKKKKKTALRSGRLLV